MIGVLASCYAGAAGVGLCAVSFGTAKSLEECDGDETAGVRKCRVARLVPIWVIFAANDVEEVAA